VVGERPQTRKRVAPRGRDRHLERQEDGVRSAGRVVHHTSEDRRGFWCSKADLRTQPADNLDRHRRQEAEANTFAIDILAPPSRTRGFCAPAPDLARALAMSDALEISREAACRRYVEHHREPIAVLFSRNGRLRYAKSSAEFPRVTLRVSDMMPDLPGNGRSEPSRMEEADAADWLVLPYRGTLSVQTLRQQEGWATTLLHAQLIDDEDEDHGIEDAAQRFERWSRGSI
jgi:hypothetical protein